MEFKHGTPKTKIDLLSKKLTQSPFTTLPTSFSTPPSQFSKIINPFEQHLVERLHLPTFSPSVFTHYSTPKTERKFKWTIDDISSLKPADIDEATLSQHTCHDDDPHAESEVQKKIATFFSSVSIAPSPMSISGKSGSFLKSSIQEKLSVITENPLVQTKSCCDSTTQTVLTLPPVLPPHIEEALKPYFTYTEDQQQERKSSLDGSLYRRLFKEVHEEDSHDSNTDDVQSLTSSPAKSISVLDFSLTEFSPNSRTSDTPFFTSRFQDCTLSPIKKSLPRSPVGTSSPDRLDLSHQMSVDASLIVPDVDENPLRNTSYQSESSILMTPKLSDMTNANWSMEYKQITMNSFSYMDVSNSSTPHSRLFVGKGQRKRLSESFKNEEAPQEDCDADDGDDDDDVCPLEYKTGAKSSKMSRNNFTDLGYGSQECSGSNSGGYSHVFASTPSKSRRHLNAN